MTVYTDSSLTIFYLDDDAVSAFTDDNGETVIIVDALTTGPRVFTIHFV
jgi:hypothetical protein